jgi:hypothetical protein
MSFLATIFGGGAEVAGKGVAAPIEAVGNALDKLFTSDDEKAAAAIVMEKLRQQPDALQVELNKIEAGSGNWFVAGWRPAIGWVCAISLAAYYWPQFVLASIIWVKQCLVGSQILPSPVGQIEGLMELVFAMLGLGLMRTVEKFGNKTK